MIFTETELPGAYVIDLERREDERGFFARGLVRRRVRAARPLDDARAGESLVQHTQGIVRGMHFQVEPHAEDKLVRCTRGAIYDVIIDLRPESETYKRWIGVELDADSRRALYVPKGSHTATRRSRPTPRPSTKCPSTTRPRPRTGCAGTIPPSASSGPTGQRGPVREGQELARLRG